MPRPSSGPRRIDSSGYWYAVKQIRGKKHFISLKTKLYSEAMKVWPEAQAELEQLANPKKIPWNQILKPWPGEEEVEAQFLLHESEIDWTAEDNRTISWARAKEIAEKRYKRRKGKDVSKSWGYNFTNALRQLHVDDPLAITTGDVRAMVDRMEEQGYKATTIDQRTACLSGVIEALIKGGYVGDEFINPFSRVDTAAIGTDHYYKALPEDYKMVISSGETASWYYQVLIYTGARITEVLKGDYSEPGWLKVYEEIAKNKASIREVPLPPHLGPKPNKIGIDNFRPRFNKVRPHDELTPHSFRHGWRSAARLSGADELTSERLLGHSVGAMNAVYGVYPRDLLIREAEKVWGVVKGWTND